MLAKKVKVIVDRKMGTYHPVHKDLFYEINYGYIKGIIAGDGEEQDAYILGVEKPLLEFEGVVKAIIHRKNDVEDKWVVAAADYPVNAETVRKKTAFQEKYFDSWIEVL